MKKIIILALSLVAVSAFAADKKAPAKAAPAPAAAPQHAAPAHHASASKSFSRPYGLAGCGLGSQVMGKSSGQVLAATTNGTSYSQLFGITSGTSNCLDNPNDEVASRMDKFINVNRAAIATDIARGNGETLASISTLAGCKNSADLGAALQKNFGEIFPSHKVQANEITDSIITVIKSDAELSTACNSII